MIHGTNQQMLSTRLLVIPKIKSLNYYVEHELMFTQPSEKQDIVKSASLLLRDEYIKYALWLKLGSHVISVNGSQY